MDKISTSEIYNVIQESYEVDGIINMLARCSRLNKPTTILSKSDDFEYDVTISVESGKKLVLATTDSHNNQRQYRMDYGTDKVDFELAEELNELLLDIDEELPSSTVTKLMMISKLDRVAYHLSSSIDSILDEVHGQDKYIDDNDNLPEICKLTDYLENKVTDLRCECSRDYYKCKGDDR